jgi:hypothetical protein
MSGFSRGGGVSAQAIQGGSGLPFEFLQDAIDGEQEDRLPDTTQAGTVAGTVKGSASLASDDGHYVGYYVIKLSSNPPVAAQVTGYVGATKTLTLDSALNLGVGTSYVLVKPAVVSLSRSVNENITINKALIINLNGYRIAGTVDMTAGDVLWINGGGGILSKGLSIAPASYVDLENLSIGKRPNQAWSIQITAGANRVNLVQTNVDNIGTVVGL